ncbi:AMP-dependent synthetase/ligase [Candidatus Deferrimicrobium sp.]|uniref:AMP-dependent synthetase/ligase n=1 Tax=Candidatus Deferrimicrobium sp. TaxID=3060586 RepID=UPI002ED4A7B3
MTADTLPKLLQLRAGEKHSAVALREKEFGIWQRVTWEGYLGHVRRFCLGLTALGLSRGDKVSILSENCREWLYAELAVMSASAVGVGVYSTSPAPEVKYVVGHSESSFVVAQDQEQADKILEVIDGLPLLRKIVVRDMKGLRRYGDARILSFEDVEALGVDYAKGHPTLFDEMVSATVPDQVAFLIYTSGTTGFPKGAMITHRNILAQAAGVIEATGIRASDTVVSYLPLCHVAEQIFSVFLPLSLGMTVNFAESLRTIQEDLREIAPTVFLGVPRIWEKLQASILIKIQETGPFRRWLFGWAMERGRKAALRRAAGEKAGTFEQVVRLLEYLLVSRSLQNYVGLRNARLTFTAAAAISPEVLLFFHSMGIPVREGYGMTECTGFSFLQREGDIRLGTVGRPIPGMAFRIEEDGELLKAGEAVFPGYYRDPEATASVLRGGWLHTGDVAQLDPDGHLRIMDRKKAIIVTSGGKNVSPSLVENTLKVSPYIKEAVVLGEGEKFLAALIQIDFENTGQWATALRLPYTNFRSLSQLPEVRDLIAKEVERLSEGLAPVERIRKFRLLEKELDHDDNEVTATMKVRRKTIYEKFTPIIREIYG